MTMKNLLALLAAILSISTLQAQAFLGAHYTTKDAILSNTLNPAMGIAGDTKWQVNLFGFHTDLGNNYFAIKQLRGIATDFDKDNDIQQILDGKRKAAHTTLGFTGPGGFVRIKQNNAIHFGVRGKAVATFNDLNEDFVYSLYNNFNEILEWLPAFKDERASAAVNAYHEIYLGYSRSLNIGQRHSLHIGFTTKLITNVFNAQFVAQDLDFNKIVTSPTDSFINAGSSRFDFYVSDAIDDGFKYKFGINGVGFDAGVIYEFKRKDSKEHFVMAGISANDMGFNKYKLGSNSRSFIGNNKNIPADHLVTDDGETINLDAVLDTLGTKSIPTGSRKIKLPTTINAFVDVRVANMFFINTNFQFNPLSFKRGDAKANMPMNITVTPRFEHRIVSVYLPINWNQYSGFNVGTGFRVGQFTFGSSSIITSFAKKQFTGIDLYLNVGFGKVAKNKKTKTPENTPEPAPVNSNATGG